MLTGVPRYVTNASLPFSLAFFPPFPVTGSLFRPSAPNLNGWFSKLRFLSRSGAVHGVAFVSTGFRRFIPEEPPLVSTFFPPTPFPSPFPPSPSSPFSSNSVFFFSHHRTFFFKPPFWFRVFLHWIPNRPTVRGRPRLCRSVLRCATR